jgi:hypothetical protein
MKFVDKNSYFPILSQTLYGRFPGNSKLSGSCNNILGLEAKTVDVVQTLCVATVNHVIKALVDKIQQIFSKKEAKKLTFLFQFQTLPLIPKFKEKFQK